MIEVDQGCTLVYTVSATSTKFRMNDIFLACPFKETNAISFVGLAVQNTPEYQNTSEYSEYLTH